MLKLIAVAKQAVGKPLTRNHVVVGRIVATRLTKDSVIGIVETSEGEEIEAVIYTEKV